jgi:UDP-N-acetylglucosamine--N-acetylmuramyl-(pentapeptide) pyrophosphoryl-undecaprenol N-acetylglucosamine transferase
MSEPRSATFVFAGGGTGGHLFPAIAVADRLFEMLAEVREVRILFVGTKRGIEFRLRDKLGYPLRVINIRGLVRSFTPANLLVPFLVIGALWQSRRLLQDWRPDVVIGTGGYVSWPVLRMATWMGIATVLQEQNSFPGIATRRLIAKADRVYLGFDEARRYMTTSSNTMTTGNPVRRTISQGDRIEAVTRFGLAPEKKTILVLGGSQGARSLNEAVLRSLLSHGLPADCQLLWQTGKLDHDNLSAAAGDHARGHRLFAFEDRMDLVYAAADLAVARAGAITLAEIEACHLPSLLVPYPHAAGDHQRKNARSFSERGWAEVIDPDELNSADVLATAAAMLHDGRAHKMSEAIKGQTAGCKPAVDIIAEDIIALITRTERAKVVN